MTPILTASAACAAPASVAAASAAISVFSTCFIRLLVGSDRCRDDSTGAAASTVLEVAQERGAPPRRGEHERQVGAGEDEAHAALDEARHQLLVVDAAHAGPLALRAAGRDGAVAGVDHAVVGEIARDAHFRAQVV